MQTRVFIGATLSFGLALVVPINASALSTTAVDPLALGSVDAVLNYCRQVNPGGAPGYGQLKISIFGKQSAATLSALEATKQYKSGFAQMHSVLITTSRDSMRQACLDLVPSAGNG